MQQAISVMRLPSEAFASHLSLSNFRDMFCRLTYGAPYLSYLTLASLNVSGRFEFWDSFEIPMMGLCLEWFGEQVHLQVKFGVNLWEFGWFLGEGKELFVGLWGLWWWWWWDRWRILEIPLRRWHIEIFVLCLTHMSGNTVQIRNGVLKVARTRQMTRTWRLNVWWLRLELAALMYFFSVIRRLIKLTPYLVWQVNSTREESENKV